MKVVVLIVKHVKMEMHAKNVNQPTSLLTQDFVGSAELNVGHVHLVVPVLISNILILEMDVHQDISWIHMGIVMNVDTVVIGVQMPLHVKYVLKAFIWMVMAAILVHLVVMNVEKEENA